MNRASKSGFEACPSGDADVMVDHTLYYMHLDPPVCLFSLLLFVRHLPLKQQNSLWPHNRFLHSFRSCTLLSNRFTLLFCLLLFNSSLRL